MTDQFTEGMCEVVAMERPRTEVHAMVSIERFWSPEIEQSNCLNAIADKDATQAVISRFYADCIWCGGVDFRPINEAIVKRWPKGLVRIKPMAWRIYRQRKEGKA